MTDNKKRLFSGKQPKSVVTNTCTAPLSESVERRFWLVLHEPGRVPERKGPWKSGDETKIIREFIKARPTAYIDVLTIDCLGEPDVQHGPELLQILDGRSIDTGAKHNARTRKAHAPHHDSIAALAACGEGWRPPEYGEWLPDVWEAYLRDLVGSRRDGWAQLPATFRWHEFWERVCAALPAAPQEGGEG